MTLDGGNSAGWAWLSRALVIQVCGARPFSYFHKGGMQLMQRLEGDAQVK